MGRFAFGSSIDGAAVTATATGTTIAGFEPSNVKLSRLGKTWKAASGAATRVLTIDVLADLYGSALDVWFIVVVAPARRPIVGDVIISAKTGAGVNIATVTVPQMTTGALDRRIAAFGDGAGISGVGRVTVEIAAGSEVARVIVGTSSDAIGTPTTLYSYPEYTQFGAGLVVNPAEPVTVQRAASGGVFQSTGRAVSGSYQKPVRKRRMTIGFKSARYLPYLVHKVNVADIDEITAVPRIIDSRTATAAQIQEMHSSAIYGRSDPPRFALQAIDVSTDGHQDRWDIDFDIEERA